MHNDEHWSAEADIRAPRERGSNAVAPLIEQLSQAEQEIVAVLSMCPESMAELETMLADEDLSELRKNGPTLHSGMEQALQKLSMLQLAELRQNGHAQRPEPRAPWQLTNLGRTTARSINGQTERSSSDHDAGDLERDTLLALCLEKFDALTTIVEELGDALANTRPAFDGANSPVAILAHCCGMMRRWSSSVNLGIEVPRDRDAEFQASMPAGEAVKLSATTRQLFVADVEATVLAAAPAAVPSGRGTYWTHSCHGVLLHVFEELCQHLGQTQITRDLLRQGKV